MLTNTLILLAVTLLLILIPKARTEIHNASIGKRKFAKLQNDRQGNPPSLYSILLPYFPPDDH